jgi:hypothetical protein
MRRNAIAALAAVLSSVIAPLVLFELAYRSTGIMHLGGPSFIVALLGGFLLLGVLLQGGTKQHPSLAGVLALSLLLLCSSCVVYPRVLRRRFETVILPTLDPLVRALASLDMNTIDDADATLRTLLSSMSPSVRQAATRSGLRLLPKRHQLSSDGGSWGDSYRYDMYSKCWQRWEEDYIAESAIHCTR